VKIEHKGTSVC